MQRPKCHIPGCTGVMRVDKMRLAARKDKELRKKDSGEDCSDYRCDLHYMHRRGTVGCVHREDHKINMSLTQGTHKRSPYKPEDLGEVDSEPF